MKAIEGWHHVVIIYEKGVEFSLYVDSVKVSKISTPSTIISSLSVCKTEFGCYLCAQSDIENFEGDLDDIRVYNRPLSESEIIRLYHERGWEVPILSFQ